MSLAETDAPRVLRWRVPALPAIKASPVHAPAALASAACAAGLLAGWLGAARDDSRLLPAPSRIAITPLQRQAAVKAAAGEAPVRFEDLNPAEAAAYNATIPVSAERNPPARPFYLTGAPADRARALDCLTQAVYYEAGFEPGRGQQAVAQVVLNRVRHSIFPKSVCGVVYQGSNLATGCQFTFTCDGSLDRTPQPAAWARAREVAARALNGFVLKSIGGATHYHTQYVVPYWMPTLTKVGQIGAHTFYRWPGGLGLPGAFSGRYAGVEPLVGRAARAAQGGEAGRSGQADPSATAPLPEGAQALGVRVDAGGRVHAAFQVDEAKADAAAAQALALTQAQGPVAASPPARPGQEHVTLQAAPPTTPDKAAAAPAPAKGYAGA